MYTHQEEREVEARCYEKDHVEKVLNEIKVNFEDYYEMYILSEAGKVITAEDIKKIAEKFGVKDVNTKNKTSRKQRLLNIVKESIEYYERDRENYLEIFDEDALDDYLDDPSSFKSTVLRKECPVIRYALYSNAKELEKYRYEFSVSNPNDLLTVVRNLYEFANDYYRNIYDAKTYETINTYEDLQYGLLDSDDYTVYGVIGGGIKTHLLYKYNPEIFPNRSRDAIWSLWFLTKKRVFGCSQDSEFLMIDLDKSITQQNYFYPYELFAYYAHQIFILLKEQAEKAGVNLDPTYRYVFADSFLSFVSQLHDDETYFLKQQIKNGGLGFA